ncbi:MAG: hypothetical protein FWH40_04685, partial [Coriobacteriia bacterium]|nr:hypothetical protein [Coriobacteriia bacterium]
MEKLTEYRPIRQSLHSVRLVLLVVLLASSLFITSQAFAVPDITNSSAKRHDQAVYQTQLMVIYVPNLKWDSLDPDECPTLYELAETSAIANMSAPWNGLAESIAADESIELHLLDPGLGLAECDEIVAMLLEEAGNEKVVIIVSAAVFSDSPATHELTPTIIKGNGFSGLVISESTKRVGLIYGEDLLTFNRYLASLKENLDPKAPVEGEGDQAGSPFGDAAGPIFTCDFSSKTIDDRIDQLENNTTTIDSIIQTKPTINMVYMVFVYIAFALSTIVLLKMNKTENKQPGQAGLLVPLVRALWIIALSYPPASFLMFLTIPVNPSPSQMMVICGIWVVVIASIALVIGYRKHWLASLVFLFAASIAVIAIGQVFGGPLHEPGYL